jgi:YVTN family beta-propeller protein
MKPLENFLKSVFLFMAISFLVGYEGYGEDNEPKTLLSPFTISKPVAIAVNRNDGYAYVVSIGNGTVGVIENTEPLGTIDLKAVPRSSTNCDGRTPYGRCLNAIGVSTFTNHIYVTEWFYDVAHIIRGTEVVGWVYAGKGPVGVIPHPSRDTTYAMDKWTSGITVIEGDKDRLFIGSSGPNAGVVDPKTGYVYIADSDSDSVIVIDDSIKIADLQVGLHPNAITYSPSNGYVYVVNSGSSPATVSVIEGTRVIDNSVRVGESSTDLGVDSYWGIERAGSTHIIAASTTGYVYVSNWHSNSISIISGTEKIADVLVGINPNAIGIDPISGYVYVANTGSASVSVISETNVVGKVSVGSYPFDLAVNSDNGYVYVANRDSDTVSILSNGEIVTTLPSPE